MDSFNFAARTTCEQEILVSIVSYSFSFSHVKVGFWRQNEIHKKRWVRRCDFTHHRTNFWQYADSTSSGGDSLTRLLSNNNLVDFPQKTACLVLLVLLHNKITTYLAYGQAFRVFDCFLLWWFCRPPVDGRNQNPIKNVCSWEAALLPGFLCFILDTT